MFIATSRNVLKVSIAKAITPSAVLLYYIVGRLIYDEICTESVSTACIMIETFLYSEALLAPMGNLTFSQVLKKFELSLRNDRQHDAVRYLSILSEKADSKAERSVLADMQEIFVKGSSEDFEEFFDNVYDRKI